MNTSKNSIKPSSDILSRRVPRIAFLVSVMLCLSSYTAPVAAGTVAGFGGATEITQIANNIELVLQYAKQVNQYVTQLQQYDAQLKNLIANPSSTLSTDAAVLINGISGIMTASQGMGGTLAQIDQRFAATFGSPVASNLGTNFANWTSTSKNTLQTAMQAAGMHRDQYSTDNAALTALYNQSQATGGNLAALQTLAQINIKQVQQTQALGDLLATQGMAANTYMLEQQAKQTQANTVNSTLTNFKFMPLTAPSSSAPAVNSPFPTTH